MFFKKKKEVIAYIKDGRADGELHTVGSSPVKIYGIKEVVSKGEFVIIAADVGGAVVHESKFIAVVAS